MLNVIDRGDVRELEMSTRFSRAIGYKVSAFWYRGFLIDTGFSRAWPELSQFLESHPIAGAIITHWHEDHAGNLGRLTEQSVPIAISDDTLRRHRACPLVPPYRWATWGHPVIASTAPIGAEHPFELIPTSGHSPDHRAIWDPEAGIIFIGDLFLGVKAVLAHADESPRDILASVRRVQALEPAAVFDAHRGLLKDPKGALEAKASWLENTIGMVTSEIAAGRSDGEIVGRLFGGEAPITRASLGQISKANFVRGLRAPS